METNENLSLKDLTMKTVTLLALCYANRSKEIWAMETKFMSRSAGVYKFKIARRVKHSKHGKNNPVMEFHEFEENHKLCPVKCLDEYINRTAQTMKDINTLSLFISMVKPFHPVTSQTISRWIVQMLASSGIDTKRFKAHSTRGASGSKAESLGFNIYDILKMGN